LEIDPARVSEEARFDGKRVLRTNTDLDGVPCLIRTDLEGHADDAFRDAAVRNPPRATRLPG